MKKMKYFSLLIILTSMIANTEEKKRDYVKIPKDSHFYLSWIVDIIILNNRLNFEGKKLFQMDIHDWRDFASRYDAFRSPENSQKLRDIAEQAGMDVEAKEEYQEKYAHLKTSEEKASEKLKMMKFPENPNLSELSDDKEIETCRTCIDILKKYSDAAEFLLSERNTKKGSLSFHKADRETFWETNRILVGYNKNNCPELLEKINFDKQIEKTSGISLEKFHKAFKLLADRYHGLCNPFSWFEK